MYISAAGIKDTTKLINDIYLKLLLDVSDDKNLNIFTESAKGVGRILKIISPNDFTRSLIETGSNILQNVIKDMTVFSNTLIVIDDLERISETIKIEDFLYRIYDTFISKNVKVLFVANEKEIKKTPSKYTDIKEKLIRHTISLHDIENKSFASIIDSIANDKLNDTEYIKNHFIDETFFNEHIEDIKYLFNERKHFNLRTFITYLDLAKKILPIDERLKEHKDILIKLLNALCFALIELNNKNRQLLKIYADTKKANADFFNNKKITPDIVNFKNYFDEINKIHIPIDLGSPTWGIISDNPLGSFIKYIETGYLDEEAIIKNYEHILSNGEEYDSAYSTLQNDCSADEKKLEDAIAIVISKIKKNPAFFSVQNLVSIFNKLKDVDYLLSDKQRDVFKDIKHYIKDGILKINKLGKFDKDNINIGSLNLNLLLENHELYDMIQKAIDEANTNMKKNSENKLLTIINESTELGQLFYTMNPQQKNMIFAPQFLERITVRPFAITLFKKLVNKESRLENKMQACENLKKYVDELDYHSYDKHTQIQIDALKEEIEEAKKQIE